VGPVSGTGTSTSQTIRGAAQGALGPVTGQATGRRSTQGAAAGVIGPVAGVAYGPVVIVPHQNLTLTMTNKRMTLSASTSHRVSLEV
jgi:hypothetical protein